MQEKASCSRTHLYLSLLVLLTRVFGNYLYCLPSTFSSTSFRPSPFLKTESSRLCLHDIIRGPGPEDGDCVPAAIGGGAMSTLATRAGSSSLEESRRLFFLSFFFFSADLFVLGQHGGFCEMERQTSIDAFRIRVGGISLLFLVLFQRLALGHDGVCPSLMIICVTCQ